MISSAVFRLSNTGRPVVPRGFHRRGLLRLMEDREEEEQFNEQSRLNRREAEEECDSSDDDFQV